MYIAKVGFIKGPRTYLAQVSASLWIQLSCAAN